MPTLPSWAAAWLTALESGDAAIALATVTHPQLGTIRLARNTADVTSRGETFQAAYFDLDVVTDTDSPARARFSVPNVDRAMGFALMKLSGPAEVVLEVISSAYPDEPYYRAARLELRNVDIGAIEITGELLGRDFSQEPFGTVVMTPVRASGLFKRRH